MPTRLGNRSLRDKAWPITVLAVAVVLYCVISLVNHFLFKTYALDLGLYNHALYDYAHFKIDDCTLFKTDPQNILSDHFDLYLPLLSPLHFVFGSYTLLIVQILSVLLGAWGIYKLIGLYTDSKTYPLLAMSVFLSFFGIWHALSFDYHSNVLSAMLLPWFLYAFKKERYVLSTVLVVLFVIGKENISLWLVFIALALMWDYRKNRKALWHLGAYALFGLAYFFVVNMVVMPALGGSGGGFRRYAHLGGNYAEIARNLLSHPGETLQLLFINIDGNHAHDGVKAEFYLCAMASGLLLAFFKPNYLLMLLPLIGQKMLSLDYKFWGVSLQYSVEFAPVLVIAAFLAILNFQRRKKSVWLAWALLGTTLVTSFYTLGNPKSYFSRDKVRFYQAMHYEQKDYDVREVRRMLQLIPDDASVCATMSFVPHLAFREQIYNFPIGKQHDPDYYFLVKDYWRYNEKNKLAVEALLGDSEHYEIVESCENLVLLRKK